MLAGAGCVAPAPPPPPLLYAGLPVSGDAALAARAGFADCVELDAVRTRCRRTGVRLFGAGPFRAAVDLDRASGFDHLTLWSDADQDLPYAVVAPMTRAGWRYCYTGTEQAGDQAVFTRAGEPVRVSVDISYYGKRRVRLIPAGLRREAGRTCTPDESVLRFGADVAAAAGQTR